MTARHSVARPLRLVSHVVKDGAQSGAARRAFATSAVRAQQENETSSKASLPVSDRSELPNLRHAQRGPQGRIHAPIVNPAGPTSSQPQPAQWKPS